MQDPDTVQTSEADVLRAEVERLTGELAKSEAAFEGQCKLHMVYLNERAESAAFGDRLIAAYHTGATVEPTDPPVTIDELCNALSKAREWYSAMVRAQGKVISLEADIRRLTAETVAQGADLAAIHSALRGGADQDLWPPDKTAADAVQMLAEWYNETLGRDIPRVRLEWGPWEDGETSLTMHVGAFRTVIAELVPESREGSIFYSGALEGEKATVRGPSLLRIIRRLATLIGDAGLTMPDVPPLPGGAQ